MDDFIPIANITKDQGKLMRGKIAVQYLKYL